PFISKLALVLDIYSSLSLIWRYSYCLVFQGATSMHTKFRHPSDTMFWIDPQTNDYLWKSWIEEIELISEAIAQ
ncbi:hypothetical protein, partial [Klebsiella variicola]